MRQAIQFIREVPRGNGVDLIKHEECFSDGFRTIVDTFASVENMNQSLVAYLSKRTSNHSLEINCLAPVNWPRRHLEVYRSRLIPDLRTWPTVKFHTVVVRFLDSCRANNHQTTFADTTFVPLTILVLLPTKGFSRTSHCLSSRLPG
jgi:hypothetical protein